MLNECEVVNIHWRGFTCLYTWKKYYTYLFKICHPVLSLLSYVLSYLFSWPYVRLTLEHTISDQLVDTKLLLKELSFGWTSAWRPRRWPAWPRFARAWRRCAASPTGSPTTFTSGWSCYIFSLVSLQIAGVLIENQLLLHNTKLIFSFWSSYLRY